MAAIRCANTSRMTGSTSTDVVSTLSFAAALTESTDLRSDSVLSDKTVAVHDDGIAVVSYRENGGYVNNISARNNVILNNKWGRNMSVVGGQNIHYENNLLDGNPMWACLYISQENAYNTYGAHFVTAQFNTFRNCGSQSTGHAAVMIFSDGAEQNDNIKFTRNDIVLTGQTGVRMFGVNQVTVLDSNRITGASPDYSLQSAGVSLIRYTSGMVGYVAP